MKLPGSTLLKVSGIIWVVLAGIGVIGAIGAFGIFAALGLTGGLITLLLVYALIATLISLFIGLMALLWSNKKEKAGLLFILGVVAIALVVLNIIFSFVWLGGLAGFALFSGILDLVLPILVVIGASKNKAAA